MNHYSRSTDCSSWRFGLFGNDTTLHVETETAVGEGSNDGQLGGMGVSESGDVEMFGVFTCFPELPPELREQIWKSAIVPRLVHWRPGGGKLPRVVHASSESRALTLKVR